MSRSVRVRPLKGPQPAWIDRDAAADLIVSMLGSRASAWNGADIRGKTEVLLAQTCLIADSAVRIELAEDIAARAVERCTRLLTGENVPEHVRSLSSPYALGVEADLIARLSRRATRPARRVRIGIRGLDRIDPTQAAVVGVLAGDGELVVVEGAAGAGKTTALRSTHAVLARRGHRLVVVTPTLKAAEVAANETGADGHSASWLIHQHGWRWDVDGQWSRRPDARPDASAQLRPGDLLLIDEAGMLDQDTARALLAVADEFGARVAFVGDRHQLPAVGRGGVLDHAIAWVHPTAVVSLEKVHRFTDPDYAAMSLRMRKGGDPAGVFDELHRRGRIVIHASDVERTSTLAVAGATGDLVIADRREQVADLNATIREQRSGQQSGHFFTTASGERLGVGDRVATRRNNPDLQVANRQTWTITEIGDDGGLVLRGRGREHAIPVEYAKDYVELAYATTVHGAQGDTVDRAHVALSETTGAAATYVAMTRGRESNTAHLVAESVEDARQQWIDTFSRDRADLGPARARRQAIEAIDRYGPAARRRSTPLGPRRVPATSTHDHGLSL